MFNGTYNFGRRSMLCLRHNIAAGMLLLAIAGGGGLQAQNTQNTPPVASPTGMVLGEDPRWDLIVSKGFLARRSDNKTVPANLRNIVDYLREQFPANVVMGPGVGDLPVTDLKLAAFQWEPALEALRVASGGAFIWRPHPERSHTIDPTTGLAMPPTERTESDLYVLEVDPRKQEVEVFNLGSFLQGQDNDRKAESLMRLQDIIQDTATTAGAQGRLGFKFHDSAALYVVTGPPEGLEIARKVLLSLPQVSASRADAPASSPRSDDELRERFMQRYGLARPSTASPGIPSPSAGSPPSAKTPQSPGNVAPPKSMVPR